MNFGQAIASGFKKYVDFTGRPARDSSLNSATA